MRALLLSALLLLAGVTVASAETQFRIASWNIANFTEIEGVELRPSIGTRRYAADLAKIRDYAEGLDADVIALQEIASVDALRFLFPEPEYTVYPSEQMLAGSTANEGEIYTAFAVRNRPDLTFLKQDDLNDLAVIHAPDGRYTRSGTAIELSLAGKPVWFLSVHLKSSCSSTRSLATSTNADCVTLWSQRIPLRNWIAEREAAGDDFAIMGDFNRQLRRYGTEDPLWQALSADGHSQPALVAHPVSVTRLCPTRLGNSTEPIDWILLSADLSTDFRPGSYWETRYSFEDVQAHGGRANSRLSDHCPIQIDLVF